MYNGEILSNEAYGCICMALELHTKWDEGLVTIRVGDTHPAADVFAVLEERI